MATAPTKPAARKRNRKPAPRAPEPPKIDLRSLIVSVLHEELNQMDRNRLTPPMAQAQAARLEDQVAGQQIVDRPGAGAPEPKQDREVANLLNEIRMAQDVTKKYLHAHFDKLGPIRRPLPPGCPPETGAAPTPVRSPLGQALAELLANSREIATLADHLGDELAI